jgi:hypothetical protein
MIKSGRYGTVKWAPDASVSTPTPVEIASLNSWKLSMKTNKEDVTCFGDPNKVYVPGIPDISGSLGGFFDATDLSLVLAAASGITPGILELGTNENEPTMLFKGPAYMDADIDCTLAAPKLAGTFNAAGAWTIPAAALP